MPFAIVALSLLSRKKQNQIDQWTKLFNSLEFMVEDNPQLAFINRFLLPSFNDLSSAHYSVERERLIRSWVAEGFVKQTPNKTVEVAAEDCLNELIERNLVLVSQWEVDGRVRSYKILNLVRGFIISKAVDYNFVKFSSDSYPSPGEKVRRPSVKDGSTNFANNKIWRYVRTLFLFMHKDITPSMIK